MRSILPGIRRSVEFGSLIIHSLETGIPRVVYGNVANQNLIENLPVGCCVEVPCVMSQSKSTLPFSRIFSSSGGATVDQSVGAAIAMFKRGTQKERPLTHDLLADILRALGPKIERVIVNDLKRGTYFARLVPSAENGSQQKKIIEIDARPSDCIAMATAQHAPIYVSLDVWDEVEDMTEALRKMQEEGSHGEESDEEEDS
jgi:bifunctional DNase/RNase